MTVRAVCIGALEKVGLCLPVVSDIVGLLWRGGEDECCIVCCTRLAHLTDLRDSPFYYTSTNHIRPTAGRYSSVLPWLYICTLLHFRAARQGWSCVVLAVGLSLWTYADGIIMQFEVNTFRDQTSMISDHHCTHTVLAMRPTCHTSAATDDSSPHKRD